VKAHLSMLYICQRFKAAKEMAPNTHTHTHTASTRVVINKFTHFEIRSSKK